MYSAYLFDLDETIYVGDTLPPKRLDETICRCNNWLWECVPHAL